MPLSPSVNLETTAILKQTARTHRRLAELKGAAKTIPNEAILINTLALQEAKDSSTIENIVTTNDELFQADPLAGEFKTPEAKEVHDYAAALRTGFHLARREKVIRLEHILEVQAVLVHHRAGLRQVPGTVLRNQQTGTVVYEPPQDAREIEALMANFVDYLNRDEPGDPDPLIRMAILHHQFESIHPFYDGNGRTGRILNLLHMVLHQLLDLPVLYLSRYIVRNKENYYRGLQAVRGSGIWEEWTLYMLQAVEETSLETLLRVGEIKDLMAETKIQMRTRLPRIYSQDLLNNLFHHPYTKIEFVEKDLEVSRPTATSYLKELGRIGLVRKMKAGRTNYYVNERLVEILRR